MGAWVSVQLAEYIRELGYSARAHHFHNYQVLPVPIAVDCGMGELSRAGYLITKEYGLALRLAVVTTDMPMEHDKPIDIGVQSFCSRCKICAEECPVGAIPKGEKTEHNGIMKWKLDEQKCYHYWQAVGTDCGICMASCPWTKPQTTFNKIMAEFAAIKGPHQSLMVTGEKLVYGKHKSAKPPAYLDGGFDEEMRR
jgi:reductive dehalogenase